ncbi:MAG: ABC transporter substrate-binding protein, partial [Solirubrobacterales bacterium]|nr:ABC transporter substrate-binding protein [Solirubrobacterales bacterium]
MTIVDYTTPNGRVDFNQLNGVEGAIDAANASGGINGKHIVLLHCDAHSSPSAAAACANEAIHSGAVAIVNNQVNEDFITTPLLMKAGIPIVGNNPSTPPGQSDPNSACFVTSTVPTFVGMITALAQQDHVKKIGVLEPPIPGAVQINAALKAAAQVNGVQITNIVPVGFTVTNFGPALQQVLSGGTEAIIPFSGGGPAALAALIQQA